MILAAKKPATAAMLTAVLFGVAGCTDLDHVELCPVGNPAAGVTLDSTGIRVPQGTAVGFKLVPFRSPTSLMGSATDVWLETDDPEVLGVSLLDHSTSTCRGDRYADWYFGIYGVDAGQTLLRVWVANVEQLVIPVEVTSP